MSLVKDHSEGAYSVSVLCCVCHKFFLLANMVSDPDGPPFYAYYCSSHAPVVKGSCNRDGCTRPECQTEYDAGPEVDE